MEIGMLNKAQLKQLRKEICLGSLFIADYENSFGIDPNEVCEFFDGFIEMYESTPRDEWENAIPDKWYPYDTIENLWNFYLCIDWEYDVERLKQAV